jgi:DNA-binding transcriptional regulator LsrR (DeoR family)
MVKLRRGARVSLSEAASLRLRAAWLYYNHGLTQKDVAEQLGIGRTTVISLLDEALKRGEVRIWIEEGEASCM